MAEHKHPDHQDDKPSVWQTPFVQKALPFLSSLVMHLGIIVIGIVLFRSIPKMLTKTDPEGQIDPRALEVSNPLSMPEHFLGASDMNTTAQQDAIDAPDLKGITRGGPTGPIGTAGGGAGPAAAEVLAEGPQNNPFGAGLSIGSKIGDATDGGNLTNPQAARFGPNNPGGRSIFDGVVHDPGNPPRTIVFVCDGTGSMIAKIDALRDQLHKFVAGLNPTQFYTVIFFQEHNPTHAQDMVALSMTVMRATPQFKKQTDDFMTDMSARGDTDPIPALKAALALHPDVMYFLVDPGDFKKKAEMLQMVNELNVGKKTHINTIAFLGRGNDEAFLKQMAEENGGAYSLVQENDLER